MMTMKASFGALAILLVGYSLPASAENACGPLAKATSLDINLDRSGRADVTVTIAGRKFNMLVDTGGIFSLLTQHAATSLNLSLLHMNRGRLRMYGGGVIDTYVKADDIQLGQLTAPHWKFPIIASLVPGVDGTLSPDILRNYDVDLTSPVASSIFFHRITVQAGSSIGHAVKSLEFLSTSICGAI